MTTGPTFGSTLNLHQSPQGNFPLDRVKEESVSRTRRLAFYMVGAIEEAIEKAKTLN